jgi:hypothetical protein
MATANMPFDVFISYSSADKTVADAACAALEAAGVRCWIAPRDIRPGIPYGAEIVDAIGRARVMVLIFSANANKSPQIQREVERAVSKGVAIIPLRIENTLPTQTLEYFIGTVHWLDALTPPIERHLQRLTDSVRALLMADRTPGSADGLSLEPKSIVVPNAFWAGWGFSRLISLEDPRAAYVNLARQFQHIATPSTLASTS